MKRFLRIFPLIIAVTIITVPILAYAIDPGTVQLGINFLPANLQGWAMIAWAFMFYVVGPILKKLPSNTIAAKAGEYITQDTPRPPVVPGDAG